MSLTNYVINLCLTKFLGGGGGILLRVSIYMQLHNLWGLFTKLNKL